jgi:hypothetical protein
MSGVYLQNFETSDGLRVVCVLRTKKAVTASSVPSIGDEAAVTHANNTAASDNASAEAASQQPRVSLVAFVHQRYLRSDRRATTSESSRNNHSASEDNANSASTSHNNKNNAGLNGASSGSGDAVVDSLSALLIASHE